MYAVAGAKGIQQAFRGFLYSSNGTLVYHVTRIIALVFSFFSDSLYEDLPNFPDYFHLHLGIECILLDRIFWAARLIPFNSALEKIGMRKRHVNKYMAQLFQELAKPSVKTAVHRLIVRYGLVEYI